MSKMPCPSDYRFGDSSEPSSPDFEGQDPQSIFIPYDFHDEDGLSRRADLAIDFYQESDGDDGYRVTDASITHVTVGGVSISTKAAAHSMGDLPDDSELVDLVTKAQTWEKRCLIDLDFPHVDAKHEYAKIQVVYSACPPDPSLDGAPRPDIRYIEFGKNVEVAKFKFVPLSEFKLSYPDVLLPAGAKLTKLVELAHEEKFGNSPVPVRKNVFKP